MYLLQAPMKKKKKSLSGITCVLYFIIVFLDHILRSENWRLFDYFLGGFICLVLAVGFSLLELGEHRVRLSSLRCKFLLIL